MVLGVRWTVHGDGRTPAPGAVVRPDERLSWPRTFGLGAQHVVAMFGASFVAPVLMGLDPNLAIMMSGVATGPRRLSSSSPVLVISRLRISQYCWLCS
ncbi:hypothetical protein ACWELQ_09060, partial [Nocardia sp. NPDC004722]